MSSSEDEESFSSRSPSPSQQKENKKKRANTKTIEQVRETGSARRDFSLLVVIAETLFFFLLFILFDLLSPFTACLRLIFFPGEKVISEDLFEVSHISTLSRALPVSHVQQAIQRPSRVFFSLSFSELLLLPLKSYGILVFLVKGLFRTPAVHT